MFIAWLQPAVNHIVQNVCYTKGQVCAKMKVVKSSSSFVTTQSKVLNLPLPIWVSKLGAVITESTFFILLTTSGMATINDLVCVVAQWMVARSYNKVRVGGWLLVSFNRFAKSKQRWTLFCTLLALSLFLSPSTPQISNQRVFQAAALPFVFSLFCTTGRVLKAWAVQI